jgi:D-threonate/D-erythronate kinase
MNAEDSRPRWGLLADDLTGACDAAVQFAQRGFCSIVLLQEPAAHERYDLVARTSDTRNDPAEVARSRVEAACSQFVRDCRRLIYKKIDSTLRGNLGAEIQAAVICCESSVVVICPAFPAMGRTLEDGWLRAPNCTGGALHLPSLLREQGLERVHRLHRAVLRNGAHELANRLDTIAAGRKLFAVLDAATDEDLAVIAEAALMLQPAALTVGSAGLAAGVAGVLASRYGADRPKSRSPGRNDTGSSASVVLFIGSKSPVTAAQVELLVSSRPALQVKSWELRPDRLRSALDCGQHLLLAVDLADQRPRLQELWQVLAESRPNGLVFSGGDTAQLICRELRATGILLECELVPGVPCGRMIGGIVDGCLVVTKAGGFGARDALVRAVDFLSRMDAFTSKSGS